MYAQIQKDYDIAKASLASVSDYVEKNRVDLSKAAPQAGEYAVYQKRLNEGLDAQVYARQQVRMYEVRLEERKVYVQRRYYESLTPNGRKWPDNEETTNELSKLLLLREKYAHEKIKLEKKESVPRGTPEKPGSSSAKDSH